MRIAIQMLYTSGWVDLARLVVPNIVNYCRKHGYTWNIQCINEPYDAFEKIRQIQKIFENNEVDVVMSMDCDAIITNYNKSIEILIEDKHDFYITKDYNNFNAGVFIFKKSEWALWFLKECLSMKSDNGVYCEQDAFIIMIRNLNMFADKLNITSQNKMNSYLYELYPEIPPQTHEKGQWQKGDFVLHLPGVGMNKRVELIQGYLKEVIYE